MGIIEIFHRLHLEIGWRYVLKHTTHLSAEVLPQQFNVLLRVVQRYSTFLFLVSFAPRLDRDLMEGEETSL